MIETGTFYCPDCDEMFPDAIAAQHRESHEYAAPQPEVGAGAAAYIFLGYCLTVGAIAGAIVANLT